MLILIVSVAFVVTFVWRSFNLGRYNVCSMKKNFSIATQRTYSSS
jgi:hypothetical protein